MTKPKKWVCTQRRLRSAWASAQSDQSSQSEWRNLGSLANHWAHSKDSDQTGRMPRLIWVFAGHTLILLVLSCSGWYVHCIKADVQTCITWKCRLFIWFLQLLNHAWLLYCSCKGLEISCMVSLWKISWPCNLYALISHTEMSVIYTWIPSPLPCVRGCFVSVTQKSPRCFLEKQNIIVVSFQFLKVRLAVF